MKTKLGTYYLGATIADVSILQMVRHASISARTALGIKISTKEVVRECHMTLVPPFHTTYREAKGINLRSYEATLFCEDIIMNTQFLLGNMMTLIFEGASSLCFHVNVAGENDLKAAFLNYVNALRLDVINSEEFSWVGNIPSVFKPHITILNSKESVGNGFDSKFHVSVLWNKEINRMVLEHNRQKIARPFLITYPTIYAKYKKYGWQPLSSDPTQDL